MRSKLQISLLLSLSALAALGCDQQCLSSCIADNSSKDSQALKFNQQRCLMTCECAITGKQERDLVDAVTLAGEVQKAKEIVDESFKLQSALASCETKEKEIALKEETAHYVAAYGKLQVTKDKFDEKLRVCGLHKDCDMSCVRECSFWTHGHWANCFHQCQCVGLKEDTQEINDYQHHGGLNVGFSFGVSSGIDGGLGHNWNQHVKAAWAWLSLDDHNKCHAETYFHDGTHQAYTCPSSVECFHHGVSDKAARARLQLSKELRSAAAAVFQYGLQENANFTVGKDVILNEFDSQISLSHNNDTILFSINGDGEYSHAYGVNYHDANETEHAYWVIFYPNLDGSLTGIIGDGTTFVFLEAIKVTFVENEASLGGFTIQVQSAQMTSALHRYFAGQRESHLKSWGVWSAWVKTVEESKIHDIDTNTTQTIYSYGLCRRRYTDMENYVHQVILTNRTYQLPEPNLDWHFWDNVTSIEHKYTFNSTTIYANGTKTIHEAKYDLVYYGNHTFRLYQDGKVYTNEDEEEFICSGGIDALKEYLNSHYGGSTLISDYTMIHFGKQEFKWYHDLDSSDNSTGTVVNSNGDVVTQDGLEGLRKYLQPKYRVIIVNGVTYWLWNNGRVSTTKNETVVSKGGLDALKVQLKPKYTTYIINGDTYKVFINGKVEDSDGKVVLEEGGVHELLKMLTEDGQHIFKTKTTIIINGQYYKVCANGTVTDEEGKVIFMTGGIEALRNKYFGYTVTTVNGANYKVYTNGTVTTMNGTVIAEDGGEKALIAWYEDNNSLTYTIVTMCNGQLVKLFDNDTVATLDDTQLDKHFGYDYTQKFCNNYDNKDYYTTMFDGVFYRIYSDGNVTKEKSGELVSQDGFDGWTSYVGAQFNSQIKVNLQGIDEQFIIHSDENQTVWDAENEKQLTTGGYFGLIDYLNEQNRLYTVFHWFNKWFRFYPNKNTIAFDNDVYFMKGNAEDFVEFISIHQLVSFFTENGQYDIYLNINNEEESFCTEPGNTIIDGCKTITDLIIALDDYVADVMSVVAGENVYTLRNGTCTDQKGNIIEGVTTFAELDKFAKTKRVGSITTIWTINGVYKYKQVNDGNFTTMDGEDLGIGNKKTDLFLWAQANLPRQWALNVFDTNSLNPAKPLTWFDIFPNGDVYHFDLIMRNSSVTGVTDLINEYTSYTQIFSVINQQIYTIHNYDTKVYDGEGKFVCNGGRQGLALWLKNKYDTNNFVWNVNNNKFHCDIQGYCVDALGNDARFTKYFESIDGARVFKTDDKNVKRVEVIKNGTARDFYWHTDSGNVNMDKDDSKHLFATEVETLNHLTSIVAFFWREDLVVDYFFQYANNSAHYLYNVYSQEWYNSEGEKLLDNVQDYEKLRETLYEAWMDRTIWNINGAEFTITKDGHCLWADGTLFDIEDCDIEKLSDYLNENWGGVWTKISAVHEGKADTFTFFHNGTLIADDKTFQESIGNKNFKDLEAVKDWLEEEFDCAGNVVFAYYKNQQSGEIIDSLSKQFTYEGNIVKDKDGNVVSEEGIEGLKKLLDAEEISIYNFKFEGKTIAKFEQHDDTLYKITNKTEKQEIDTGDLSVEEYLKKWKEEHKVPYIKFRAHAYDWDNTLLKSEEYKLWEKDDGTWIGTQVVNGTDSVVIEGAKDKQTLKNQLADMFGDSQKFEVKVSVIVANEDEPDHLEPEVHTFLWDKYGNQSVVINNSNRTIFMDKAESIQDIADEYTKVSVWDNVVVDVNQGEFTFIVKSDGNVTYENGTFYCNWWNSTLDNCISRDLNVSGSKRFIRTTIMDNEEYGLHVGVIQECEVHNSTTTTCYYRNETTGNVIEGPYEFEQLNEAYSNFSNSYSFQIFERDNVERIGQFKGENNVTLSTYAIAYKYNEKQFIGLLPNKDVIAQFDKTKYENKVEEQAKKILDQFEEHWSIKGKLMYDQPSSNKKSKSVLADVTLYFLEECSSKDKGDCQGILIPEIRTRTFDQLLELYGFEEGRVTTMNRVLSKIEEIFNVTHIYDPMLENEYYDVWNWGLIEKVSKDDSTDRETVETECNSVACFKKYLENLPLNEVVDTSLNKKLVPLEPLEDTRPVRPTALYQFFSTVSTASYAVVALAVTAAAIFVAKKKLEKPEFDPELRE